SRKLFTHRTPDCTPQSHRQAARGALVDQEASCKLPGGESNASALPLGAIGCHRRALPGNASQRCICDHDDDENP
ncbi:Uncharacterized protein TPAR_02390, partial [Tolypocladium paradoxum]